MAVKKSTTTKEKVASAVAPKVAAELAEAKSTVAKKAESVVEEIKEEAKKVEEKATDAAKAVAKATKETTKKTTAKKTTKTTASKAKKVNVYVQFNNREANQEEVLKRIVEKWVAETGKKESSIKSFDVYVKPEDNAAYYVINGQGSSIELF